MADKKQLETSKIDALYSWISYDLQKLKGELLKEMNYSSVQVGSLYQALQTDKDKSSQTISQEIRYSYKQNQTIYDGLSAMIDDAAKNVLQKLELLEQTVTGTLVDQVKEQVSAVMPQLEEAVNEIKYSFMQHQAIYDGLTALISGEVVTKLDDAQAKLAILEQLDSAIAEVNARVAEGIALFEDADYKAVIESVAEKTEESVAEHSRQVLDAVAAIPVAENVDYNRIVDEVGDKVLELLGEVGLGEQPVLATEPAPVAEEKPIEPVPVEIDYDKIVYGTAEKVVESIPYPEKVNYRIIDESIAKALEKVNVQASVEEDAITAAVNKAIEKAVAALDIDAIASAVAAKLETPTPQPSEIDYDLLADKVADKLSAKFEQIEKIDYDKVSEAASVDYDRIALIVADKLDKKPCEEPTYELVVDEEGVQAIAKNVSEEICKRCATCEAVAPTQAPVEEEKAEEQAEAPVEEIVEEPKAEEVSEELAVATEPVLDELNDQLVDAETGLVIRLKKSFTAKMKQSDEKVKAYYSDIKNGLTSYKKINSNISWHGDRFNYGRDTVAKMNICGKTLCFYLALDPEDPEYKTTVYHQKNVGGQKAYESTPFMVKIKSDAAAKKALRLVGYLADKLGTTKEENFETVNYAEEFAYETTKQLFDAGYIKATKEKKVELDF
ncbi:MAG: hypothetical protein IJX96_05525 [Clostridia bacterium]|nr:hypothetical protein [Clostridia bacterium]